MPFTIAIDGPAAAGKGTISKAVAAHFGFAHLDTGLLYRAVGRRVLDGAPPVDAARSLRPEDLEADSLRTPEVARAASRVAALSGVRAALLGFQRTFARRDGGAVLDGRDIGTVICPEAEAKLFVTARPEVRADRRYLELKGKGLEVTREQVIADMQERDARDAGRSQSPLRPAPDAMVLDTSGLDLVQAVVEAIRLIGPVRG